MDFYGLQTSLNQANSSLNPSRTVSIHDLYFLDEKIGKGEYGVVWKGRKKAGESQTLYAIKQINMKRAGAKGMKDVLGEVETMAMLNHRNIVRLEETFKDGLNIWIVMEYLSGGELQQILTKETRLTEDRTRMIVIQLLQALEYIHSHGIVHRDLKPSNCLFSKEDDTVKLSDFGFAVLGGSEQCLRSYCGTVAFMAPEILRDKNYGKPVDMWALGVMTYMMYVGELPFGGENVSELIKCISRGISTISTSIIFKRTPSLREFILGLLNENPNKRFSAKDALRHDWIVVGLQNSSSKRHKPEFSSGSNAKQFSEGAIHRFRAVTILVMACHRLLYWSRYRLLVKIGSENIPILRNLNYIVTGKFQPKETSLNCSEIFCNKPAGLEHFLMMLESAVRVETVDLSKNNISSLSAVQALLKLLSIHPSIVVVNLSGNPIPPLAGRGILRLARNPNCRLRQIILDETGIPPDIMQQIYMALKEKARLRDKNVAHLCEKGCERGGGKEDPPHTENCTTSLSSPPRNSAEMGRRSHFQHPSATTSLDSLPLSIYSHQNSTPEDSVSRGYSHVALFASSTFSQGSSHQTSNRSNRSVTKKRSTRLPPLPHAALPRTKRYIESVE